MIRQDQLDKWKRGLRATFPILGGLRRHAAMTALETHRNDPVVVPLLADAAALPDAEIADRARQALADLESQAAVDALCALWAKGRDERLGAVIAQRGYVAAAPPPVRALSGLKAGAADLLSEADGELTQALVAALDDRDSTVSQNAGSVLRTLRNPAAIDALCALWAKTRDQRLGQILAERRYIASQPLQLKILTALKCGNRVALDRPDVIRFFVGLLGDTDQTVRSGATRSLERVAPGPAQEALCEEAIKNPRGEAAKLCVRTGKRPGDPERLCLFLFVTALLDRRQLDEYFKEDYEFQNLRLALERADGVVRGHVMEVYRSGDRRVQGLIPAHPKTLEQLSDQETQAFVESCVRHGDWQRLFEACLRWPARYSVPALRLLADSDWEPEAPDLKSVYRQIVAEGTEQTVPPRKKPGAASSLFEQWLARGRNGPLAQEPEAALRARLRSAAAPEAVSVAGTLAAHKSPGAAEVEAVQQSPHWLVRLAGHAAGIAGVDLVHDEVQDANYWVRELARAAGVLDFWPIKATPADIQKLAAAPPEAWTGRLGAARRILNTILQHQNVAVQVEDMVVAPDEYGVIVEDA